MSFPSLHIIKANYHFRRLLPAHLTHIFGEENRLSSHKSITKPDIHCQTKSHDPERPPKCVSQTTRYANTSNPVMIASILFAQTRLNHCNTTTSLHVMSRKEDTPNTPTSSRKDRSLGIGVVAGTSRLDLLQMKRDAMARLSQRRQESFALNVRKTTESRRKESRRKESRRKESRRKESRKKKRKTVLRKVV
jgi:hypothetical protein